MPVEEADWNCVRTKICVMPNNAVRYRNIDQTVFSAKRNCQFWSLSVGRAGNRHLA